ncbi:MAG: amino acid ABC transporter ATP-binding protein [Myxococcales bacterium]|nr:amino acid ABC transporter ATP-binding protein [Myxococcales bacterium]
MIRVAGLTKRHAGAAAPVLSSVSFEVPSGSVAAVLGRSGSGKTTLLRCLCGLEPFESGTITVEGAAVLAGKDRRAAERGRVGLVFQSFELFPHLTVLDNCMLAPITVRRLPRAEAEAIAERLLAEFGLADKAGVFPDHLSGGQRQRVAIARALAMEPRVLLYDEPTSALDPSLKREVLETLRRVQATGVTQVLVTHDVWLAREAAERIFILDRGAIVEQGPAADVLDRPTTEAARRLVQGES